MYDVIALGEVLIDFAGVSKDKDGYPTMAAHPGGAPANFLAAINKFGGKTGIIAKVGTDTFGRLLKATLEDIGVDTRGLICTDDVFTTLAFVSFDEHGEREFAFSRKPGADTRLSMEETDLSLIDEAKVFHFGTLSLTDEPARSATCKALEYARSKGRLISYDPNLRKPLWKDLEEARKQLLWGLGKADVVKISDDEVDFLFGLSPEAGAKHILDNYDVKLVFVTCGAEGCVYANRKSLGFVPALTGLNVIDTCGAGDIFGGSAVWKILSGNVAPQDLTDEQLKEIVSFACTAAGLSTERPGGISSIPDMEEVLDRMK